MGMGHFSASTDGDKRKCPRCRDTLVFSNCYPLLTVGMALTKSRADVGDGIRVVRAWICRNGGCDYRELLGDA
jgi:hypothetical protein